MNLEWIFFDCFNTLIDDFDEAGSISGLQCIMHVPVDAGLFIDGEQFRLAYESARRLNWGKPLDVEVNLDERLLFVLQQHCSSEEAGQLTQQMIALWQDRYVFELRLGQGVPEMLTAWQARYKLALVSNFYLPQWPEKFLAYFELDKHFTYMFDSAAIGYKKPDARFYQHALTETGADPASVLFVGDCPLRDVQTPRQHGMAAIHRCRHGERPGIEASSEQHCIRDWHNFRPESIAEILPDLY